MPPPATTEWTTRKEGTITAMRLLLVLLALAYIDSSPSCLSVTPWGSLVVFDVAPMLRGHTLMLRGGKVDERGEEGRGEDGEASTSRPGRNKKKKKKFDLWWVCMRCSASTCVEGVCLAFDMWKNGIV